MRIVIDFQGAQGESRVRGIGRYTLALVRSIVRNRGQHEIVLALNGAFPDTIDEIRAEFADQVGAENIRAWDHLEDTAGTRANSWRSHAMEQVREYFIHSLRPDIVLVTSLFDGYGDDVVTSVGTVGTVPTATVLYDLIPLVFRETYLRNPSQEAWYFRKLGHVMRSDLLLCISQSACDDAQRLLGVDPSRLVNIAGAADDGFRRLSDTDDWESHLRKLGIDKPFVMCTGGIEPRKNLRYTIEAFGRLPVEVRDSHQLVIVWQASDNARAHIREWAEESGVTRQLVVTGYVSDETLVVLYNACKLFVAPSLYEGFGLPALEAMKCGAPVIASNTSSFPEVLGIEDALFDPHSIESIGAALEYALVDDDFRERLRAWGKERPAEFTWDRTARAALEAMEGLVARSIPTTPSPAASRARPRLAFVPTQSDADSTSRIRQQLLVAELARRYELTIIASPGLDTGHLPPSIPHRRRNWLRRNPLGFDRVLYDLGPGCHCADILPLLRDVPGIVLLQDGLFVDGAPCSARTLTRVSYETLGYAPLMAGESPTTETMAEALIVAVANNAVGVIANSDAMDRIGAVTGLELLTVPRTPADTSGSSAEIRSLADATASIVHQVPNFIESAYGATRYSPLALARSIGRIEEPSTEAEVEALAEVVSRTFPPRAGLRQLLVDVSELARRDSATGIQRVVKQILRETLQSPPEGFRVEPVYFDGSVYRYARKFTSRFFALPSVGGDDAVDFRRGDVLLGLDLDLLPVPRNAGLYKRLRSLGVTIWFVVYDILCVRMPQHFVGPMEQYFKDWLPVIGLADGLACISQAVADDVRAWYESNPLSTGRVPALRSFHLGADFRADTEPLAPEWRENLESKLQDRATFLMVGTIESRKGHRQVLDAFEALWASGHQINLVIVGKTGWLVEDVIVRLRRHAELNRRLFWFEGPSDEELIAIYQLSSCLIAASEGEGFGLPLVEAAHHGLPILARDLPVFREVARDHAAYFSGLAPDDAARAIEAWLELDRNGSAPQSTELGSISWQQSAEQLMRIVTQEPEYSR